MAVLTGAAANPNNTSKVTHLAVYCYRLADMMLSARDLEDIFPPEESDGMPEAKDNDNE